MKFVTMMLILYKIDNVMNIVQLNVKHVVR
jgi:hypothetical protein